LTAGKSLENQKKKEEEGLKASVHLFHLPQTLEATRDGVFLLLYIFKMFS
jgi:hypothetical protein